MPSRLEKSKYTEGEKVLCFHGPLLYEARCVNVEVDGDHYKYFVHYQGWNKTWDEWVTDDRIIKFNDVGLRKQVEYQEKYKESRKKNHKKKSGGSTGSSDRKKKSSKSTKGKKMGSASEASNLSFLGSEVGEDDDDGGTEAGTTSIVSEEEFQRGRNRRSRGGNNSSKSGTRKRKFINDNKEPSEDGTNLTNLDALTTNSDDKMDLDEDKSSMAEMEQNSINQDEKTSVKDFSDNNTKTVSNESTVKSSQKSFIPRSRKKVLIPLDENITDLEAYSNSINIDGLYFTLPEKLRFWLTDDWDLVTRQSRLCNIPARITVNDVLGRYRLAVDSEVDTNNDTDTHSEFGASDADKSQSESQISKIREMRMELIDGIKKYFNVALGSMLLYKFERQQYFEAINKSTSTKSEMSSIYSAIYILRLLVNIQKLVTYTRTDKLSLQCLSDLLQHFVEFLDTNSDEFFKLDDYVTASADYTRRAMC